MSESISKVGDHVSEDLACVECGYNLRTLACDACCPECGASVLVSMRGDRLSAAPSDWLHRVVRGAWWLRVSVVLAFPVVYLGVALSCYGIWALTAAQPGRTEPSQDRSYRLAARWMTAVGSAVITAMVLGSLIIIASTERRLVGSWNMQMKPGGLVDELPVFDIFLLIAHAIYVLGLLSTWRYLRVLAERMPDDRLARAWRRLGRYWIGTVLWLAGACGTAYLLVNMGVVTGGFYAISIPVVLGLFFAVTLTGLWLQTMHVSGQQARVLEGLRQKAR